MAPLREGFLVVVPLFNDFISGDDPPPFFATCVACHRLLVPLQQWGYRQSIQALLTDLHLHVKDVTAVMVKIQEP